MGVLILNKKGMAYLTVPIESGMESWGKIWPIMDPLDQGRIQEFWKGEGPVKGRSPKPSAKGAVGSGGLGASPRKF